MEVLTTIVGKIAEVTVIPIGRQIGYLLFYKENIEDLTDKIEELEKRKSRIGHDVEAERKNNGREIEDDVVSWQKKVDETLKEAKKLCQDELHASVWCWKLPLPNLKSRHLLGRNAKKMAFKIAELKEKGSFYGGVGYGTTSDIANLIFATTSSEKLESRNFVKNDIMASLADPKVSKVGIYGWGGVGKTTLAKEIAKQVKDDKLFDVVAMTTISQTLDVERVQDEIAYQLGFHLDEKTLVGRADRLCARIKKEKNVLIVLDDLWDKIDLDKLGIPCEQDFKNGKSSLTSKRLYVSQKNEYYQGCKLLLTSRGLDTLKKNETQKDFPLEALNNAESMSLFELMVGDAIKDPNLQKIAAHVVERCVGLPVMIVSIAKSLKYNKNIHYWKDALNSLKRVDIGNVNGTIFSAFEFTYNRLEDDEMKKVFLLCGLLGPSIWVSDLLKYVIGLGVLKYMDTIEDARNRLYRIIDDLKASCLLLEDDESETAVTIRMHDIICEVAVSIAHKNEHVFVLKRNDRIEDWPSKGFLERCTQINLKRCSIQELPQKLDCPNLKFFFLNCTDNRTLKIPNSFFEGMGSLEALDLTGLIIPSLPTSLVSLTKLKTLCLDHCTLKHMDGIGNLVNLEILSLMNSHIRKLPSEMSQLTHMRMLDLSKSRIEDIPPCILSKLTKIEELYMGNASINWEEENSTKQNKSVSLNELVCLSHLTTLEIQIREAWMMMSRDMIFDKLERYKVVIGDKWEWSGNKRTSRLLKLKLHSSIHLEHGIKALIKQVEDLYLDEAIGISNVLFHLNSKGFPLLKHLHIQNNGQVQHIVNIMDRNNETHVLFPELETLVLHNLNKLVKICNGPLPVDSFRKLTTIEVKCCDQLMYLLPILMVKALPQLTELHVSQCNSMKRIVLIDYEDGGIANHEMIEFYSLRSLSLCHLPVIHDFYSCESRSWMTTTPLFNGIKVNFSNLETLKLNSINVGTIWDDDPHFVANSLHNLVNLIVEGCGGLKYLFSSSLIGSLSKLKYLEISKCEIMEEIIAPKRINNIALEEVRFLKLETMVIKDMKKLKKVWHFQFESLKTLEVSNCGKLVNIFPHDMQRMFGSLETLKVTNCGLVEEIFELASKEVQSEDESTPQVSHLKKLHLLGLPKLKQIWSRGAHKANHRFHNLQLIYVESCEDLEYLFPFSIAMQANQLEYITIKYAWSMKHIVLDKESPMDNPVKFEFNHLTSLIFWHLFELEGLFIGNHSVLCPILRELDIRQCGKLNLFKTQSTSGRESIFDGKLQISMQKSHFTLEEMICNLETLALNSEDASMILQGQFSQKHFSKLKFLCLTNFEGGHPTFPYWFLQNITNLKKLVVEWGSFREIFQSEIPIDGEGKFRVGTRIEELSLNQLHNLQYICNEGFQIDPVLENLNYLLVQHCSNLKKLVPSSVIFSQLTDLEVENCEGLLHLITPSTARSLVKLTTMRIMNCNSLEQVVTKEREGSEDEISFESLEILELECLPMIKMFCSSNCVLNLPSLIEVVVNQCPRMSIFSVSNTSTPMLQHILLSKEDDGKKYWEGDLNKTMNKMFMDMVGFHSLKHLELYQYPELRESWFIHVQSGVFGNLRKLVVHKCDFLSDVLLPLNLVQALSNLEELQVSECDSVQVIFKFSSEIGNVEETTHLQKLTLLQLSNLKQIWSRDGQANLSFANLRLLWVENCHNLQYLFPFSIAMQTIQLEHIIVRYAWSMKHIILDKEGLMNSTIKFEFNNLISLILWHLYELEGFFTGNFDVLCPSLRELDIRLCENLKLFKTQSTSGQDKVLDSKLQISKQEPLFTLEKVICNLEGLALNSNEASMILQGQSLGDHFSKLEFLCLENFKDDHATFPYWFLQNITTLKKLLVEWSSFKEIFLQEIPIGDKGKFGVETRIEELSLNQLHNLQYICKDGFEIDPVLENLKYLVVQYCSNLKYLVPSSVTLSHLTHLEVENCNGLLHLISSSSPARSLVKLTTMKIRNCNSLEQIVVEQREESEYEITFRCLEILELECLPMIKMFFSGNCVVSFPSLVKVVIKQCPRMKFFSVNDTSTPNLHEILSKEEDEKNYWEGDLNKTINKMFLDMVAFHSFWHLELSQYPELRELWYNPVEPKAYGNLKSLVVHKCDFLSDVLLPLNLVLALANLEELNISECNSLEAVFNLINMDQKEVFVAVTIQLKTITLSNLLKLKHIWKQNVREIVNFTETTEGHLQHHHSIHLPNLETIIIVGMPELKTIWHPCFISNCFDNLETMQVSDCGKIENIFPSYMQRAYASLETLMVSDCNSIQVIFEFSSEVGSAEETTQLLRLTLLRLSKLKEIWSRYVEANLRFHNLQSVWVEHCEKLEYLFPFSIAMHVIQLEDITIKYARSMKYIISDKEVPMNSAIKFEFNHLISLELWHLYELEGLFAGNHSVLCPSLKELDVSECGKLKLFKKLSTSGQERFFDGKLQLSMQQQPLFTHEEVSFPSLETIKLSSINLRNIWDYHHLYVANCIHNLVYLTIDDCRGLKHLFSYSVIGSLLKLEYLKISRCEMMEEIISQKGTDNISLEEVRLSKLETLIIKDMKSLKNVWHLHFESLKTLEVSNCEKLENIFPSDTQGMLGSLKTLNVSDCASVEEIFQLTIPKEIHSEDETTKHVSQLQTLHLFGLPKLKQIWSKDVHQANICFHNLQLVHVEQCVSLEYLFPFSIAMQATELESITIKHAWSMKQIVSHKEGILDGPVRFEFNHLITLELWNLHDLNGFFSENHNLQCPSLRELDIRQCGKLKVFKTQSTSSQQKVFDSKVQNSMMEQPLFTVNEVSRNLERLVLNSEDASIILQRQFSRELFSKLKFLCLTNFEDSHATFPYWFLEKVTTLNELHVECSSFKEIFQEEKPIDDKEKIKIETRIEKLTLNQLHELQHICKEGCQIDPILEGLEYLSVQQCSKLKNIVPSSVTFSHLTYLEVNNCNGLIHLITSSTAKGLVNLRTMIIRNCNSLEQVVAEDREGSEEEVIAFNNLGVLELECLPTLKMFCSSSYCSLELPWLYKVVISNCPRMEIFSLGKTDTSSWFQNVLTHKEDEKGIWDGDLNTTVNKIFQNMADQIVDKSKQEIPDLPSSSDGRQEKENASSIDHHDAEESHDSCIGTQEMGDTAKKPSISISQNLPSSNIIPNAGLAKETQEMGENIERPLAEAPNVNFSPTGVYNAEANETMEIPASQIAPHAQRPATVQEGSHESETCPTEDFLKEPKTLVTAVGAQEIRETMDKPLIQTDQDAEELVTTQNTEESHDSNIESQKMCDSIKKPSSPTAQNVPNSTIIPDTARVDPLPAKAQEPVTSSILQSNAYRDYKLLIDISKQNFPHLEAGLKRHPQVLDWFNTKGRGVFIALFAEVTRILRTNRRCELTEDDRNYIKACCAALEAVGFDASWLNYVYGCIESCEDGDELKRKLEETKAKASTLRNELASVEASLASLQDKASRLDTFIES